MKKLPPHETIKGHVTHFVVQLEVWVQIEWKVAIRYDSSHGFTHVDQYDISGKQTKFSVFSKRMPFVDIICFLCVLCG